MQVAWYHYQNEIGKTVRFKRRRYEMASIKQPCHLHK